MGRGRIQVRSIQANQLMKKTLTGFLWLALACVVAWPAGAAEMRRDDDGARQLARLVNRERERAGLERLEWDERIAEAAWRHARLMAERGDLSHQFPGEAKLRDRMAAMGARFNDDAENVAYDSDVEGAHIHLMQSPGHRANILNPRYNAIGTAVVWRGGRVFVVEDFARSMTEESDVQVAAKVLAAFNRQRRAKRLAPVTLARDLHAAACRMAETDKVSTAGMSTVGATSLVAYTTFQPDELPQSVKERVGDPLSSVAIGACFARTKNYPSGIDWVVMAFYR